MLRVWLICAAMVTAVVVGFLFSPSATGRARYSDQADNWRRGEYFCGLEFHVAGRAHVSLSCDAGGFMYLAGHPGDIFESPIWQGRPLYPVVGFLLAAPLRAAGLDRVGRWRGFRRNFPEYVGFLLLNWVLLVTSAVLLHHLTGAKSFREPRLVVPLTLLLVNWVTKAWFWSPHLQLLNLLLPLSTLAVLARLQRTRAVPTPRFAAAAGLALGVGGLAYAAFAVPAGALALWMLFGDGWAGLRARLAGRVASVAVLFVAFGIPMSLWAAVVIAHAGRFAPAETEKFHEFVWIGEAAARGLGALASRTCRHLLLFAGTIPHVLPPIGATFVAVTVAGAALGVPRYPPSPAERRLSRAALLYLAAGIPFYALMGYYAPRLTTNLLMVLLPILGREIARLEQALPTGRSRRVLAAGTGVAALVYAIAFIAEPGPYP